VYRLIPILVGIFLFLIPSISYSQIQIVEVMANPEGSDTDREWIRIYNSGSEVNMNLYRFLEAGVNHKILEGNSGISLGSGEHGIIADNVDNFLSEYPDYSGSVFKSSFSLNNTGEQLTIVLNEEIIDEIVYPECQQGESALRNGNLWSCGGASSDNQEEDTTPGVDTGDNSEKTEIKSREEILFDCGEQFFFECTF
jgi:hypothetical protein